MKLLKKIFLGFASVLSISSSSAQVNTLPYSQGFEDSFIIGTNVEFLPNWFANETQASARVFRDATNMRTGAGSMALVPTATFNPTVEVFCNFSTYENIKINFFARSVKNGTATDNRPALLYISTSTDGGSTYSAETQIGDDNTFPNDNTGYNEYSINLSTALNNQNNVKIKLRAIRGAGTGTAARLVIDDFLIDFTSGDFVPPTVNAVYRVNANSLGVIFSEAVNQTAEDISNYTGIDNLVSATRTSGNDTVFLSYSVDFPIGVNNTLIIANIEDLAENTMNQPYQYSFLYNNTIPNLVISEILYDDPSTGTTGDSLEFVEIYNNGGTAAQLGGLKFTKGIEYTFPEYLLESGEIVLVARNATIANVFFGVSFLQWNSGTLNNAGETLEIRNTENDLIDSVEYKGATNGPWPTIAANAGRSIELVNVNTDNNQGINWVACNVEAGAISSGAITYATPGNLFTPITIADTIPPTVINANLLNGNTIRIVFSEVLNQSVAEDITNYSGINNLASAIKSNSGVADTVILNYSSNFENGITQTLTISGIADTSGNVMTSDFVFSFIYNESTPDLIITEIMYDDPSTGTSGDSLEFLEVYNNQGSVVQLGGLKISKGVVYVFPEMSLNAGEYVLLAKNAAVCASFFGVNFLQWTSGSLNNAGETIEITNSIGDFIDSVWYSNTTTAPWPTEANGNGASIELQNYEADNNLGINWMPNITEYGSVNGTIIKASPGTRYTATTVSANQIITQKPIIIYPNPFKTMITIENNTTTDNYVKVYDILGKEVFSQNNIANLNLSMLTEGIYMLVITDKDGKQLLSQKIIKN
jgi:hypothetical protein